MVNGKELGNGTPHGSADHMRRRDSQRLEKASRVIGHVIQGVRKVDVLPLHYVREELAGIGALLTEVRGEAYVAIVVTDDMKAAAG